MCPSDIVTAAPVSMAPQWGLKVSVSVCEFVCVCVCVSDIVTDTTLIALLGLILWQHSTVVLG